MKALILAAGLGTRLRPHTLDRPKALFPLAGRPLLDRIIEQLAAAGIEEIVVNTHHLAEQIEAFVKNRTWAVPVHTRHEATLLGTAGAIANLADFWDHRPFVVINSDIVTDIDIATVGRFHDTHAHPATLVLTDCARFNTVTVDRQDFVVALADPPPPDCSTGLRPLTFTGIQVLSPEALAFIPKGRFYSSIDMYRRMLTAGLGLKAWTADNPYWTDIGTPRHFREAAARMAAPNAFKRAWPHERFENVVSSPLGADGGQRLSAGARTMIMADHGIRGGGDPAALEARVAIGRHLHRRGVAVARIYDWDPFAGLVFSEDMGDLHLRTAVLRTASQGARFKYYRAVIDELVRMWSSGAQGTDPDRACRSTRCDERRFVTGECRNFITTFVNGYLQMALRVADFDAEFESLAAGTLAHTRRGFMHGDMQSRNIMLRDRKAYFIGLKDARPGPLQYDLAALLTDPYVALAGPLQGLLLSTCIQMHGARLGQTDAEFQKGYTHCTVTRSLHVLGAWGKLSRAAGNTRFKRYLPVAAATLGGALAALGSEHYPRLTALATRIAEDSGLEGRRTED